jgi:hypothetical protein
MENNKNGIMMNNNDGKINKEDCVWGNKSVWKEENKGKVLEISVIKVNICVWSNKCAVHGWSGAVVFMVISNRVY